MSVSSVPRDYRTLIACASLVTGPLLMTIGSLVHPEEKMDTNDQVAIVVEHATRWYASHAFLLAGLILSVPGFLALTALTASRHPSAGYASRVLILIGTIGLSGVFTAEMILGRFVAEGADPAVASDLLDTVFTGQVAAIVLPAALAFFLGIATLTIPLVMGGGPLRWPAVAFGVGGLFILGEIITAQHVLAMIGSALLFAGSAAVAALLLRGEAADRVPPLSGDPLIAG